jgi:hypothetical protein
VVVAGKERNISVNNLCGSRFVWVWTDSCLSGQTETKLRAGIQIRVHVFHEAEQANKH